MFLWALCTLYSMLKGIVTFMILSYKVFPEKSKGKNGFLKPLEIFLVIGKKCCRIRLLEYY